MGYSWEKVTMENLTPIQIAQQIADRLFDKANTEHDPYLRTRSIDEHFGACIVLKSLELGHSILYKPNA